MRSSWPSPTWRGPPTVSTGPTVCSKRGTFPRPRRSPKSSTSRKPSSPSSRPRASFTSCLSTPRARPSRSCAARSRRPAPTSWPRSRLFSSERTKEAKLEKQIINCKLFAPGDGIVVYANDPQRSFGSNAPQIEEGATVRERQKIFSLPDITRMQVNTKVHESQIDKITPGMKARIRVDAFSETELAGTVLDVAPLPDPTSFFSSDVKVYTTRVKIDNPLTGLRPGMNAEVTILVDRKENVLSVPVQAILEYSGKDHLAVRTPNGYDRREVELGATNDKFVEVTKGITPGAVVALNPLTLISENEKRELFGVDGKAAGKKDWVGFAKGKGAEAAAGGPTEAGKGAPRRPARAANWPAPAVSMPPSRRQRPRDGPRVPAAGSAVPSRPSSRRSRPKTGPR